MTKKTKPIIDVHKNLRFSLLQVILIYAITSSVLGIYQSINNLPNLKEGFSQLNLGLPQNARPLYYIDINNDK